MHLEIDVIPVSDVDGDLTQVPFPG
jgi:hypothetical protein